jgi:hypothetical protein
MSPPLMTTLITSVDNKHLLLSTYLSCDKHHGVSIKVLGSAFGAFYLGLHIITILHRHYMKASGPHLYQAVEIRKTY